MAHIYPVGGGKGGIGKSFITASLGALLAAQGKRVVVVDLDLGGANLHTFLGVKKPKLGLNEFLNKNFKNLEHVAIPTPIHNLFIISSVGCPLEIANLFHTQKLKIIKAIHKLPYDYILLDLGAGTNFNTVDFFLTSNDGLFVLTPEPTSIENSVRFIKAIYLRRIKQILKQHALKPTIKKIIDAPKNLNLTLSRILEVLIKNDPDKSKLLQNKLKELKFKLILNQSRKHRNANLGYNIEKICNKHFYSEFQFLGNINYDEKVHESIFSKEIYMDKYSYTLTATDLQAVVKKINQNGNEKNRY